MPPHLHPRSRLTSSLFATTLFASFFVVALPHALPCPAPRVAYADEDVSPDELRARRRRRQRRKDKEMALKNSSVVQETTEVCEGVSTLVGPLVKSKRECPVPKPSGIFGDMFGFGASNGSSSPSSTDGKGSRPP
ncbi:alpha-1,3-mannosyltransferase (Alg3), putative [Glarea lozoyensis ATCC 20868]|uniref:Alpha-1,3-mannosyltransferase (Alg3), putative n=1 Tax=Glarea lozoyensis (strain ATCC 20868 / MF5171) TaxID=1116229 RepID=S3CEB6_GLAL2|nr:alpha-1,3-mannosyltransferase (Alg3), putative [Glarea lozoyensis ATCC 20868]EPE24330.1 alpha-1,3-mannosyltransferase (Alg3), putative [Glarea lozoyensis ATCC 20868]